MRHRDMPDAAWPEKTFLTSESAIDELIDQDEIAGREILAQAADRRQRDDVGDPAALQRVDIGAKVDRRGRQYMPAAVPRQKDDRLSVECAETEFVRGPAVRAFNPAPSDIGETVDPVEPAAADNTDNAVGHGSNPRGDGAATAGINGAGVNAASVSDECATRSCASRRRRRRSLPAGTA